MDVLGVERIGPIDILDTPDRPQHHYRDSRAPSPATSRCGIEIDNARAENRARRLELSWGGCSECVVSLECQVAPARARCGVQSRGRDGASARKVEMGDAVDTHQIDADSKRRHPVLSRLGVGDPRPLPGCSCHHMKRAKPLPSHIGSAEIMIGSEQITRAENIGTEGLGEGHPGAHMMSESYAERADAGEVHA